LRFPAGRLRTGRAAIDLATVAAAANGDLGAAAPTQDSNSHYGMSNKINMIKMEILCLLRYLPQILSI
jgi:hypothetical protein